jgi:ABC-type branched-subunit amino acid transport system substrate-binding protein
MTALVANPNVVAVIGPLNSSVAKVQIPLSNAAGLLQCSPANTNEGLTKPEFGALDIRKTNPTKINYVRVVTTDDNQGPAAARYILEKLGKKTSTSSTAPTPSGRASPTTSRSTSRRTAEPSSPVTVLRRPRRTTPPC